MWRRLAFLLTLLVLAAYAYAPLWGTGPIGPDLATLLDVGPIAWPVERGAGAGSFELLSLYRVEGVHGRPLAAALLAGASRLLTDGGRWTGAEVDLLRLVQLGLLMVGAWGLVRFVRRALLPWSGAEGASTAGYASALVLALHPLAISVVARPASVGDLAGLALATWAGTAFLRGRQDREHGLVGLACALTIVCGLLSELAYLLALVLALVELTSARRYRPLHVRLRTAGTTLAVFGAAAAVELALRAAVGAPASMPGLVGVWIEGGEASFGTGLAIAVEKLGLLIMPVHPFGRLGALGYLIAAVALLLAIEPALVAARSAPRLWGWLLGAWCAAIVVVELSTSAQRVPPETLDGVATLFPAVIVMAVGLGVSATALSGTRRSVMPLVAGVCYAVLAHGAALPYEPAAAALAELRADLDRAREAHGRDAHFLVVDPPDRVDGLEVVGAALPRLLDPALTGEPETPTVEGIGEAALYLLARQPELEVLRRRKLVLVVDAELLAVERMIADDGGPGRAPGRTAGEGRFSVLFPPPGAGEETVLWRADPSTPLVDLDPLHRAAVRITAAHATPVDEVPIVKWRSSVLNAELEGAWLAGAEGPVAFFDLTRSLAWLVGRSTRRVWVEGDLALNVVSGEILTELPEPAGVERRRDGEAWRFELARGGLPRPLGDAGDDRAEDEEGAGPAWVLSLLDLSTYAYAELPVAGTEDGALLAPGAATWQELVLRRGGGPIAWTLDLRAGETTLARAAGRIDS